MGDKLYAVKARKNYLIIPHVRDYTIRANSQDMGATLTNTGASASVTFALPESVQGMNFEFYVTEAQELKIDPYGTETIAGINGVQGAAGDYLYSNIPGARVRIKCDSAGAWNLEYNIGNWVHSALDPSSTYIGDTLNGNYTEIESDGTLRFYGGATTWDDLLFPLTGQKIDVASGRINYDYFNGTVNFNANARYPEEPVGFAVQIKHKWKEGSVVRPHIHWLQQHATEIPNWLLGYKISKKNTARTIETDFSNHTFLLISEHRYTYASGVLNQISHFTPITLTGVEISDMVHFVLFRDTGNVSTLFAGADPSALGEHIDEFDVHIEIDSIGSNEEYVK